MGPRAFIPLVFLGWLLWRGYQRRRGVWTARSWRRFALLLAAVLGAFAVAMAMAYGVDRGVYAGMSPLMHRVYFYTLMALVLSSPVAGVALVLWFANGQPDRQLGRQRGAA